MSFADAVRSVFSQYAVFTGRARRSEYWWFVLFTLIVYVVASILDAAANTGLIVIVVALALVVPSIAVTVRRLHDTGRSGWWYLIAFIPLIGTIVLIVFTVQDSDGPNQYGPTPKNTSATYPGFAG